LAKKKYVPERLFSATEQRAESISGEFQLTGCIKHVVGVCDDGAEAGGAAEGQLERRTETISGDFKPQEVTNTLWVSVTMGD
jgi:hypothetical protein